MLNPKFGSRFELVFTLITLAAVIARVRSAQEAEPIFARDEYVQRAGFRVAGAPYTRPNC